MIAPYAVLIFFLMLGLSNACVFITVSSLPGRKVELNWNCNDTVDIISLHLKDPEGLEDSEELVNITISDYPDGYYKTDIEFKPEPFPGGWSYDDGNEDNEDENDNSRSFCLYWVAAMSYGEVLYKNCLSIEPAWMSEYRAELQHLTLPMLFLPGTHNSGCDKMKLGRTKRGSKIDSFVLTQDQSIWNQLVYGIRFLDLRIGHYPQVIKEKEELRFWVNHDLLGVQPLIPILRDVKKFLKSSPDEIIILDFHRFPVGFKRKTAATIHRDLVNLIERELGSLILPRPLNASELTLEEIWKTNRRIVISYNEENFVRGTPWLWNPVIQKWGNKQTPSDLEKFLDDSFADIMPKSRLWAAMAELTPTPLDFLNNSSLRSMADSVNRLLSFWFGDRLKWASKANIVATDFFLGNNLVERAIEENLRRSQELQ